MVICPGLGLDELSSHRALRTLAIGLQDAGFLVLRLDYRGTGDSGGALEEVGSVGDWVDDVGAGLGYLRGCGVDRLALVGLRLGASFAAVAAERAGGVDALVVWDACTSGRSFLREQRALKMLASEPTVDVGGPGEVELLSMLLPSGLAQSLKAFSLEPPSCPRAVDVGIFERAGQPPDERLRAGLEGSRCTVRQAVGQEDFLDVEPWRSLVPTRTIEDIVAYLGDAVPGPPVAVTPGGRTASAVGLGTGGSVVERACLLPPFGMAAVVAEPGARTPVGPTVVLLNAGMIHKAGPGRVYTDLARRLAAAGMRTVRLDLPGVGDSEGRAGQPSASYPLGGVSQLVETLEVLNPEAPGDVVLAGLCSGGYHASKAAVALGARGVCLINPALYERIPRALADARPRAAEEQVLGIANPFLRLLRRSPFVRRLAQLPRLRRVYYSKTVAQVVDSLPLLWTVLDLLGSGPGRHLRALRAKKVSTLLLCGPTDGRRYRRYRGLMRRLQRDGLRFFRVDEIDHSLFSKAGRLRACELVERHLAEAFLGAPRGSSGEPAEGARPVTGAERVGAGDPGAGRGTALSPPAPRHALGRRTQPGSTQLRHLLAGRGLFGRFAYMVATQAVTVAIGLVYWAAAARLIPPAQLGIASSGISTATLVGTLGIAGISTVMLVKLGSTPEDERGILISTGVAVAVLVAVPIALGMWLFSPMLGPSFRRLGDQPLAGSLFVLATAIQVSALVLDAAAIGMRRSPVQLVRNIVAATVKVAFLVVYALLVARSAVCLLAGWCASSLVSFAVVPSLLGLRRGRRRRSLDERIELIRRTWSLSLRHHVLNLSVGAVGYLLPVVAALFLQPTELAYYTLAAVVASAGVMVPYLLSMSLFVESTGDEALLRASMRRTLPFAVVGCIAMIAVVEPAAGLVLSLFGARYAVHGVLLLRIIVLGSLGYTMKDHFMAARRAQERLGEAAWAGAFATAGELVAAGLGGWLGGVYWLAGAWLMATVVELVVFLPSVLAVVRAPRATASFRAGDARAVRLPVWARPEP